jgi:4-hydroxy-4-methyl-2-oxoglutarate aldolase
MSSPNARHRSANDTRSIPDGIETITAAMLSDSLDVLGYREQVMSSHVRPLRTGTRLVGRAATLQFAPTDQDSDNPYDDAIEFIDGLGHGDVAVVATNRDLRTAYWGELFSAAAHGRGGTGIVTDGCVRDTTKIIELGFAAYSAGSRPIDFRKRMRIVAQRTVVTCAGVRVADGDLILGDDDGVVVVPAEAEIEALELARKRSHSEDVVLRELLTGTTLRTVWNRYKTL